MRETLELRRDPLRLTMALFGSVILLFIMGYGINLDVDNLSFAVLDRDQTTVSREVYPQYRRLALFHRTSADREQRGARPPDAIGRAQPAIEIPPNFARGHRAWARREDRRVGRRRHADRGPRRFAATSQGMHQQWLTQQVSKLFGNQPLIEPAQIEMRYRYNPDFKSLIAMVPAVIPLLLLVIPANLATLSGGPREGARLDHQFLRDADHALGVPVRQADSLRRSSRWSNFFLLTVLAVTLFRVPCKGTF